MGQGKQAKVLTDNQVNKVLRRLEGTRYAARDKVTFLLSVKAGLRAKEIAGLRWNMVTDAVGELADAIALPNKASKGKNGGRTIPMNRDLRSALIELAAAGADRRADDPVIESERGGGMSAETVAMWFWRLYSGLGFRGAHTPEGGPSSHGPQNGSWKPAGRCATCSNWPDIRRWR